MKKAEQGTMSQPQGAQRHNAGIQSLERLHMIKQMARERCNVPNREWQKLNSIIQLELKLNIARKRGSPHKDLQELQRLVESRRQDAQQRWEESIQLSHGSSGIIAIHDARHSRPPPPREGAGRRNDTDLEHVQDFVSTIQEFGARRTARVVYSNQSRQGSREQDR